MEDPNKLLLLTDRSDFASIRGTAIRTAELMPVATAFISNVDRVYGLLSIPVHLHFEATVWAFALAEGCFHTMGHTPILDLDETPYDDDIDDELFEFALERRRLHKANLLRSDESSDKLIEHCLRSIQIFLRTDGYASADRIIQPWLASAMTITWTAFESLTGALWVAALNANPVGLAPLTGKSSRIEKLAEGRSLRPDSDPVGSESKPDKLISLKEMQVLTKGRYDIAHRMGELLRRNQKFTGLQGIRKAYSEAFSEKENRARTANIDKALAIKEIDALASIRNLLVHRAGYVDDDYIKDMASNPLLPRLQLHEMLRLNGEIVQAIAKPVIDSCISLIRAVDGWIVQTRDDNGGTFYIRDGI